MEDNYTRIYTVAYTKLETFPKHAFSYELFTDSYFFTSKDVIGLIAVTKKIPKIIDKMLGMIIIERFDIPETFIVVNSSVFFIFKKNQIPDIKITNGKKLFSKLGTNSSDNIMGT